VNHLFIVQSASRSIYAGASFKYAVSDPFGAMRAIQGRLIM
jgi:hypothetical protein